MVLQHIEHRRIAGRNAVHALAEQVRPEFVRDRLAHEPQRILGQPSVRSLGLVDLKLFAQQVTQPFQQFSLQRVARRRQGLGGVAAQRLRHRGLVRLDDQLAEHARVFVLSRQHEEQRRPQVGEAAQPIQDPRVQHPRIQQAARGAVQPVFAPGAVAEAIGLPQHAVPCAPSAAVLLLHVDIDGDLADVVQERRIGHPRCPCLCLRGLRFGCRTRRQEVRLPQLERVGHDLQAVVEHATGVCVVVAFGRRKQLHHFGVALDRGEVQGIELRSRQRGALPDVLDELLPAHGRQQLGGRERRPPARRGATVWHRLRGARRGDCGRLPARALE